MCSRQSDSKEYNRQIPLLEIGPESVSLGASVMSHKPWNYFHEWVGMWKRLVWRMQPLSNPQCILAFSFCIKALFPFTGKGLYTVWHAVPHKLQFAKWKRGICPAAFLKQFIGGVSSLFIESNCFWNVFHRHRAQTLRSGFSSLDIGQQLM